MKPYGDLIDRDSGSQTKELAGRATCRIPGMTGLAERRAPLDAAIFPKPLLEWASATASTEVRYAETAPAIYCLGVDDDAPHRLLAGSRDPSNSVEQRDRAAAAARHRLVPAIYCVPQDSDEADSNVARSKLPALTPRQVAVLGHVLAHIKYPLFGSHILPSSSSAARFRLTINAGAMIDRLGFARGGDAYCALEDDLATLSGFLVRHESRDAPDGTWKVGAASPLINYLNTGRCCVELGKRRDTPGVRRDEQWVIEIGSSLLTLLRSGPENFSVIGAGLWSAASRSRVDQWLALWIAGHGYDGGRIYEHRAETLGKRMRLVPDNIVALLDQSAQLMAKVGISDDNSHWGKNPTPPSPETVIDAAEHALSYSQAVSRARVYWRQIHRSINRLEQRNAIERAEWCHSKHAADVRPSQSGRALSRVDLIRLHRWSGPVEGILPRARRFVRSQWSDLLGSINGAFNQLGKIAAGAADPSIAGFASDLRKRYQERLEWLRSDGRILTKGCLSQVHKQLSQWLASFSLLTQDTREQLRFRPSPPLPGNLLLAGG